MRISINHLPGIKSLVVDYIKNYKKVAEFYNGDFRDIKAFQARTEEVRLRDIPLEQLISILQKQNQRFGCGIQTVENIDKLLEKRACAVVTG